MELRCRITSINPFLWVRLEAVRTQQQQQQQQQQHNSNFASDNETWVRKIEDKILFLRKKVTFFSLQIFVKIFAFFR